MDALDTGNRGLELRNGGDFFGSGAEMYAASRGLVADRWLGLYSPCLGEFRDELGRDGGIGLIGFWPGLGMPLNPLGGRTCPECLSKAELVRVEGGELAESEFWLRRRELIGMRDCESRLYVLREVGDRGRLWRARLGTGAGGGVGEGGLGDIPVKSLLVRLCIFGGRWGIDRSILMSSNVELTPKYHAEGDGGDLLRRVRSSGNIGFGLCMLPSEPRRRRGRPDMP